MRFRLNRGVMAMLLLLFLAMVLPAEAAGKVQDEDFSCRGVSLGDTEAQLLEKFGMPLFDKDVTRQGVPVKVYTFKKHYEAAVNRKTGKVVEFVIGDDYYTARDGIRFGATSYWIRHTYGQKDRQMIDGEICYVYARNGQPHERLVLTVDAEQGYLTGMRITSLPLTDEEAEQWELDGETDEGPLDWRIAEKEIDTSRLPKDKAVVLKGDES